jgi:hypothetical protein
MSCSINRHLCKHRERALGKDRFRHIYYITGMTFIIHFSGMIFKMPFILGRKNGIFQFNIDTHLLMIKFKSQKQRHLFCLRCIFLSLIFLRFISREEMEGGRGGRIIHNICQIVFTNANVMLIKNKILYISIFINTCNRSVLVSKYVFRVELLE